MSKDKVKASWDMNITKVFIELCLEQIKKGTRRNTSFTKQGWGEIVSRFHALTGRLYAKQQLKNKYDSLRKEWQSWDRLLRETGTGWDAERQTITADDDWWEKKIAEGKDYEKFRTKGLQFQNELTKMYSSVAATGEYQWAPSSMPMPNANEEGSGDSDEIQQAQTGISGQLNAVAFIDTSEPDSACQSQKGKGSSSGAKTTASLGVRRRGDGKGKGKGKGPASAKIADALALMVEESRQDREADLERASRAEARAREAEARAYETSIAGVLEHLRQIPEIMCDPDFYLKSTSLLMNNPAAREVFAVLKHTPNDVVAFLKHEIYG